MKTVVAGPLGECVHVAGVLNFLRLAERAGWRTIFLSPPAPIEKFIDVARRESADLVGVSYRLTAQTGERLLGEFAEAADEMRSAGVRFAFGGTPPVARKARAAGFFEICFDGTEPPDQVLAYLRGGKTADYTEQEFPQNTVARIAWKAPFPIIRHHFGLPTLEATRQGIEQIAEAGVLDVISLGVDQDAQEHFFHPERQDPRRRGAGGVPVRTPDDYRQLFEASRQGNYPLIRTYSGTDDFIRLAEMYVSNINIAWAAVPLYWFNRMDGRGPWDLENSICEHQKLMSWYGERSIPVEINEPHHWGMRDASDVIFVVTAYLAAYNARVYGVKDYITSMMFNSPPGLSDRMDLAKMLAVLELIKPLADSDFRIFRQTRTGLLSYPVDMDASRAQLATSIYLQMALQPHILHVVGFSEANHAATASEVIESCKMARRAIENGMEQPDMIQDERIQTRVDELVEEAQITLAAIRNIAPADHPHPLADPSTLALAVKTGILDAPHLRNNPYARGELVTHIDQRGACTVIDINNGSFMDETTRLQTLS